MGDDIYHDEGEVPFDVEEVGEKFRKVNRNEKEDVKEVMEALRVMATRERSPSAFAAKTFLQCKGVFVEKAVEKKKEVNGDEITKYLLKGIRELRKGGYRMDKMQVLPDVLCEELCNDTGQGEAGGSEVGGVGASGGDAGVSEGREEGYSI